MHITHAIFFFLYLKGADLPLWTHHTLFPTSLIILWSVSSPMGAILVGWGMQSCLRGWQCVLSFFPSRALAGSLEGPSVTAAALSFGRLRVMAQQAHGKMFEVDLPLYLCDWGTMACRLPLPASHWAAGSDDEKHPPCSFCRAFSCTLGEQASLVVPFKNTSWKIKSKLPGFVLFCSF